MFKDIKILQQHGKQAIRDLRKVELPGIFRGRPVITMNVPEEEARFLASFCPVGAISCASGLSVDLGKCVFCRECEFARPAIITFTNDYRMATNVRSRLIVTAGDNERIKVNVEQVRQEIRKIFKGSLKLRQVSAAGDNSSEMELNAGGNVNFDMGRFGIEFVASPRHADGLVLTGPISENMAEAVQLTWEAIPSPKLLILVGTDAISGGVFADSPALNRSFLDRYEADLYVPGNPPHPLTFIHGLIDLLGK
jgi:Ni,Fe-hydrogenase III small subunit